MGCVYIPALSDTCILKLWNNEATTVRQGCNITSTAMSYQTPEREKSSFFLSINYKYCKYLLQ